jgi:hypothetical protein
MPHAIRTEVRDAFGKPVFEDFSPGHWNPFVDYHKLAELVARPLIANTPVWSIRFFAGNREIGSWSRHRELSDTYWNT